MAYQAKKLDLLKNNRNRTRIDIIVYIALKAFVINCKFKHNNKKLKSNNK